ncbi:hypothetical protein ROLI_030050 [Roseobacter fucihabitans]|uniref:DUF3618 domain-containing protein n=1 Tax=Roseobacter fucihabitans TaxID=1537242 RepID=A0ABZ2BV68_9RHOB|nr:DUF3618 domain-containing protein [Roseobacter litoralis]MBC6967206.1 hypothetical protein [Roseobacter litoralis]
MTNENRSPKEIERDIEEQRSDLTSNLEGLQDKFSIDTIVRQIGDQFREHGGDIGRSVSDQVKANPIPLALTGIGLAWMMFGNASRQNAPARIANDGYSDAEHDYRRTRIEQGRPYFAPTPYPLSRNDGPSWSYDDTQSGPTISERMSDGADAARDHAASAASEVRGGTASAASSVSDAVSAAGSSVAGATASAKSTLSGAAQSARDGLATAGSRIAEGTESLTEEGRLRVIAARRKAVEMRRQTARSAQKGADVAADFYDNQPLVVGALALAFGAALGGALPRTKTEDDLMGTQSDDLFAEAERVFEEEKSKAMSVAKSVQDEVKDIAAETKSDLDSGAPGDKSAVEAIGDTAKSVAGRVANKAKSTAKDENLGKPKS